MRRRDVVILSAGTTLLAPLVAAAQAPGRTYRIAALFPFPRDAPQIPPLFETLRQAGFIEGQNLDVVGFAIHPDKLPEVAAASAKQRVDVIVAGGDAAIRAAQQATATIPILGFTDDMVGSGLVTSMAHPTG